jgi:hypothetical protein
VNADQMRAGRKRQDTAHSSGAAARGYTVHGRSKMRSSRGCARRQAGRQASRQARRQAGRSLLAKDREAEAETVQAATLLNEFGQGVLGSVA